MTKKQLAIQWSLPGWAADLIRETLQPDARSGAFDSKLRRRISLALSQVRELAASPAEVETLAPRSIDFYILEIVGDLEPQIHGPYSSPEIRDDKARQLRVQDPGEHNGLFRLDISPAAHLEVGAYSGIELEVNPAP